MTPAITFAFGAGLLATVSPCGFVMLPGFLGLQLGQHEPDEHRSALTRCSQGLATGLVLSAAFSSVLVFAGLALAIGLRSLVDVVPWLAVGVGGALAIAGLMMLAGRRIPARVPRALQPRSSPRDGYQQVAAFGVAYAVASLSCTLAVVLAVAGQATATHSPIQFVAVFGAFAAGSTSALIALSVSTALAKTVVARTMRRLAPAMNALAGAMLLGSGIYLLVYWLPAIAGGSAGNSNAVTRALDGASAAAANFLAGHTAAFAIGLAVALATALAITSRTRHLSADDR
jgi:cytochrome c biogenesis protein CcdA